GPSRSADADEVDDEDQRLAALDDVAGAPVAVAEVRRDGDPAPTALPHPEQTVVPALDDLADAGGEGERLAAVPRGVELLPRRVGHADVVRLDRRPCGRLGAVTDGDVLDDELARRGVPGEVDLRLGRVRVEGHAV